MKKVETLVDTKYGAGVLIAGHDEFKVTMAVDYHGIRVADHAAYVIEQNGVEEKVLTFRTGLVLGLHNEDLIKLLIHRISGQNDILSCAQNVEAIKALQTALAKLEERAEVMKEQAADLEAASTVVENMIIEHHPV